MLAPVVRMRVIVEPLPELPPFAVEPAPLDPWLPQPADQDATTALMKATDASACVRKFMASLLDDGKNIDSVWRRPCLAISMDSLSRPVGPNHCTTRVGDAITEKCALAVPSRVSSPRFW
jgi:hypothetical protein